MAAMMAAVSATWSAWTARSAGTGWRKSTARSTRTAGAACVAGAAGAVGEGRREDALQLGSLIAGQLAADTSPAIRLSIFDFRSPGVALLPPVELLGLSLCNDELMSFSAEDSAP